MMKKSRVDIYQLPTVTIAHSDILFYETSKEITGRTQKSKKANGNKEEKKGKEKRK